MSELGRDLDLAKESSAADRGDQFGPDDLERDIARVLLVVREVDRRHTSATELACDPVSTSDELRRLQRARVDQSGESFGGRLIEQRIRALTRRNESLELLLTSGVATAHFREQRGATLRRRIKERVDERLELPPLVRRDRAG